MKRPFIRVINIDKKFNSYKKRKNSTEKGLKKSNSNID